MPVEMEVAIGLYLERVDERVFQMRLVLELQFEGLHVDLDC